MTVITEPGIYPDIEEAEYHGDRNLAPELGRSLSVSGAKKLLDNPAKFHHDRTRGQKPRDVFDFGHVAHTLVLGKGDAIAVIDADDWRSKAAKDARDEARADGLVPILRDDYARAEALADKVLNHPVASAILSEGEAEKSAYWVDEATGVTRRARFDWLRTNAIIDLKTCQDASPAGFATAVAKYRYDMQAAWYQDAVAALTGELLPFIFIAVEKEAPHLVALYQLEPDDMETGRRSNDKALALYAECESSGVYPGYSPDIETLVLPNWHVRANQGVLL